MQYRKSGSCFVVRLDGEDEIISSLLEICKTEKIKSACVSGIGGARKVEIGFFNPDKKQYARKIFEAKLLEIVSLSGNICLLDGTPTPHLHILFSFPDFSVVGGHLLMAEVFPTCELVLTPINVPIHRKFNKKLGLNLQDL